MEWDISWRRERRRDGELMIGWKYVLGFIMREEQKGWPTRILGQWWLQAVQNRPRPTWSLFWIQISTRKGFLSSSTCASWSRCHFVFMPSDDSCRKMFDIQPSSNVETLKGVNPSPPKGSIAHPKSINCNWNHEHQWHIRVCVNINACSGSFYLWGVLVLTC